MLDALQRQELSAALFSAFPVLADLDLMLRTRVNQRRERISPVAAMPDVISAVIQAAEDEFWTPNLIAGALAARGGNPDLQQFIARYPALNPAATPAKPVDHYDATFFVGWRVFLCRAKIRNTLKKFGRGANSRVMVVNGPRGTGKTYSKDFIGYLLQFDPVIQTLENNLVYVDLDQYVTDLGSVALKIGRALNLDPNTLPPRNGFDKEQDSRWLSELYAWLCGGIKGGAHDLWWLVLDGFRVQNLPPEGLDLIDMLANFADTETTRLRLILLNYPRPDAVPFAFHEDIPTPVLQRADVEQFVRCLYDYSGDNASPAIVTQTVDEILKQVQEQLKKPPAEPHQELKFLSLALTRTAQRLLT
jgi:hypothetical protein